MEVHRETGALGSPGEGFSVLAGPQPHRLRISAHPASAQVLYGSVVGTLTDETGAVVPKATVTVTNTSTGLSRQATTNDIGYYSIPNLPEGSYDLAVAAGGFKPYTQTGVSVRINSVTRTDVIIAGRRRH